MRAWVIKEIGEIRDDVGIELVELKEPEIGEREVLIKVAACGVCHTEIDEIEGRAKPSKLPVVPGHQIVGKVVKVGAKVKDFVPGDRVGAGWIYSSCGSCKYCKKGLENLCPDFKATGKDADGGYAEFFKIGEKFLFKLPERLSYEECAPLFCAGAIGYRSLKLTNLENGEVIGLLGFGASAHLVFKLIRAMYPDSKIFVFSHSEENQKFAKALGADWVGSLDKRPPELLDAVVDTTPVWTTVVKVLKYLAPAGRLVINAIRKEDKDKEVLTTLSYERDLWMEKELKTVANVTTSDIKEFLSLAEKYSIKPSVDVYPFEKAKEALLALKHRKTKGAKVLKIF